MFKSMPTVGECVLIFDLSPRCVSHTDCLLKTRHPLSFFNRIRRIYFSDRLYTEEELPAEFKLFLPPSTSPSPLPSTANTTSLKTSDEITADSQRKNEVTDTDTDEKESERSVSPKENEKSDDFVEEIGRQALSTEESPQTHE